MIYRVALAALFTAIIAFAGLNAPRAQFNGCKAGFCSYPVAASSCNSGFPSISGIVGRYLACTGVTTGSGNVTSVTDQSGTSNANITNVSGTVPLNSSSAYNSHPAFAANAAGTLAATTFNLNSTTEATVCMPIIFNDTTSTFKIASQLTTTSYPANQLAEGTNSPATNLYVVSATVETAIVASTKYRACFVSAGASVASGPCASHTGTGDAEIWLGTGSGVGNAMSCVAASNFIFLAFNSGTTNSFSVAGFNSSGTWGNFISATIPEVDVFSNHQLTPTEFGNLDAYYQSNYGS